MSPSANFGATWSTDLSSVSLELIFEAAVFAAAFSLPIGDKATLDLIHRANVLCPGTGAAYPHDLTEMMED